MKEKMVEYLDGLLKLTDFEKQILMERVPLRSCDKHEVLLKAGSISREFYFVIKGCVRLYYEFDGRDKSAFFYVENQFISSYKSFVHKVPAQHSFQCIEPCTLAVISHENAYQLLDASPRFEALSRIVMEEELSLYQDIIGNFVTQNPEQRYLSFLQESPKLLQRIPQYLIASYLGVSPETLSRIRKRVHDRLQLS